MNIILGIFLIMHSLVHVLYTGQSLRFFELQTGMVWPDGARMFSGWLPVGSVRSMAGISLLVAGAGFAVGAVGLFNAQTWYLPVIVASAVFSSLIFILFWDGKWRSPAAKGLFGIMINVGIIVALLVFHWPRLEF